MSPIVVFISVFVAFAALSLALVPILVLLLRQSIDQPPSSVADEAASVFAESGQLQDRPGGG